MRPAGLTAVCIICLLMGSVGCLSLFGGCVGLVAQPLITEVTQNFTKWIAGNSPQIQQQMDQQRAIMQDMMAIQRQWIAYTIAAMLCLGAAVVGMFVGAIRGLKLKPMSHRWMIAGMVAAMLHGVIAGYVGYGSQRDSQPIMMRHMNQTMQSGGAAANPAARAMTNNMMRATGALTLVVAVGWASAKCALYGSCIWYLLTPKIRKLFESDGSDRAIIDALSEAPT